MSKIEELKVLFLAQYAPKNILEPIPEKIHDQVYAIYHHKIYEELYKHFPNILSSNDASILFSKGLEIDYIFSLYNRMPIRNSEIFVSSVAEYLKIPYLGAPPNIRALAEDKHLAKMVAKYLKIPTPKWKIYNIGDSLNEPDFPPPYFVKPRFGASSKYINDDSSCSTWLEAQKQISLLFSFGIDVILEEQIMGIYHTLPILNNFGRPLFLPCVEQRSTHNGGIVTYEQKRKIEPGLTRNVVTNNSLNNKMQDYSKRLFSTIQPLDYTRVDYIVDNLGMPYFLEFNVCCNLGKHSTISQSAKAVGINYEELIGNIVYSSLYRNNLIQETFGKNF